MKCPACGSEELLDAIPSWWMRLVPGTACYRCDDCDHRFVARGRVAHPKDEDDEIDQENEAFETQPTEGLDVGSEPNFPPPEPPAVPPIGGVEPPPLPESLTKPPIGGKPPSPPPDTPGIPPIGGMESPIPPSAPELPPVGGADRQAPSDPLPKPKTKEKKTSIPGDKPQSGDISSLFDEHIREAQDMIKKMSKNQRVSLPEDKDV